MLAWIEVTIKMSLLRSKYHYGDLESEKGSERPSGRSDAAVTEEVAKSCCRRTDLQRFPVTRCVCTIDSRGNNVGGRTGEQSLRRAAPVPAEGIAKLRSQPRDTRRHLQVHLRAVNPCVRDSGFETGMPQGRNCT